MNLAFTALHREHQLQGYQCTRAIPTPEIPVQHFRWKASSLVLRSELLVVPTRFGFVFVVSVPDDTAVVSQVQPWVDALAEAAERLAEGRNVFQWHAVIGAVGGQARGVQRVTTAGTVGKIRIHPATTIYVEANTRLDHAALTAYGLDQSYPLFVEGEALGYDWHEATATAAAKLNLLCSLFSLRFDADWQIREAPQHGPYNGRPLPLTSMSGIPAMSANPNILTEELQLDDRLDRACSVAEDDILIRTALGAFHNGLSLESVSASYALTAYVAVIEGLGAKLNPPETCDCCADCTVVVKSTARFKASLALVTSEEEAASLSTVYDQRSKVVHEGWLYAGERLVGAHRRAKMFTGMSDADIFKYSTVRSMRTVARRLIAHYVREHPA